MKSITSILKKEFTVDWNNVKELVLDECNRVYSVNDYDEEMALFI